MGGGAGGAMQGIGGFLGGIGSMKAGQAAEDAANYNAEQLRYNARLAKEKAQRDEATLRVSARKQIGQARANYGASGIQLDGSALDILEESAVAAETDALYIRYQGDQQYYSYMNAAIQEVKRGHEAKQASYLSAAGSMLGGASSMASSGGGGYQARNYGGGGGGGTSMGGGSYYDARGTA